MNKNEFLCRIWQQSNEIFILLDSSLLCKYSLYQKKKFKHQKKIKISLLNIRFCTLNHVCVCDFFGFTFFLPVHNNKKKQSRDVIYLLHNLYNNKMINFNCLIDQKEFFVVMNCHFHY